MKTKEILQKYKIENELVQIADWLIPLNEKTAHFEDELRFSIIPLTRKERRGLEWKIITMVLIVRKDPLKFDVVDTGDTADEMHLFEDESEAKCVSWIKDITAQFQRPIF